MIGIGALPTYASVVQISSFAGTIAASSEEVDLSDIEIKVYSAVFVDEEDENALDYYAETYAFSVYTDENGAFSFTKPTTYCSISVELASLPSGYGISQRTQFIRPQRNEITFSISSIASIDTKLSGDEIEVTLLNEDGAPILAEYTVHEDSPTKLGTASSATQIFQTYKSSLASVDAMESYTYTGTVTAPGFTAPYSETVDLSDWATDSKVDFLYAKGILTEEEQMGYYCDILSSDGYSISGECGTSMIGKLTEYASSSRGNSSTAFISRLNEVVEDSNDLSQYSELYPVSIPNSGYKFFVYYDPEPSLEDENEDEDTSTVVDATKLAAVAAELINIYQYFVGSGRFDAPETLENANFYTVYLVNQEHLPNDSGGATYPIADTNSSIRILSSTPLNELSRRLSHEYHHAIMRDNEIVNIPTWVSESFVSMASLIYGGYTDSASWFNGVLRSYLDNSENSIDDELVLDDNTSFPYGTLLYPLYIYENYAGWTTIKNIYTQLSSSNNIYNAINSVIGYGAHSAIFNEVAKRSYQVKHFYTALSDCDVRANGTKTVRVNDLMNSASSYNAFGVRSVAGNSIQYLTTIADTTSLDLAYTVEFLEHCSHLSIHVLDGDYYAREPYTISTLYVGNSTVERITFERQINLRDQSIITACNSDIGGIHAEIAVAVSLN